MFFPEQFSDPSQRPHPLRSHRIVAYPDRLTQTTMILNAPYHIITYHNKPRFTYAYNFYKSGGNIAYLAYTERLILKYSL